MFFWDRSDIEMFYLSMNKDLGTVMLARDIFFTDQISYLAHTILKIFYVRSAFT